MRRDLCTVFDHRYLTRGLALYRSLEAVCPDFRLFVLCFTDEALRVLEHLKLPRLEPVRAAEFERGDDALAAARVGRTTIEYYFTCTGSWMLWLLRRHPEIDALTYLDADLFFFADPALLDGELADHALVLSPHAFSSHLGELLRYGRYNAGWLFARRDPRAIEALTYWRTRCLEWCYDRLEGERYADQRYLDDWPTRFSGIGELRHPGANLAPWNFHDHRLTLDGERVRADGEPLVFFHFHGFRQVAPGVFDPFFRGYGRPSATMRRGIFAPYLRALAEVGRLPAVRALHLPAGTRPPPVGRRPSLRKRLALLRRYLVAFDGRLLF